MIPDGDATELLRAHTNAKTPSTALYLTSLSPHSKYSTFCLFVRFRAQQIAHHKIHRFQNSFGLLYMYLLWCVSVFIFADVDWHRRIASNRFQWLHSQRTKLNSLGRTATNCARKLGSAYGTQSVCTHKITENWWLINTNARGKREMCNKFFHKSVRWNSLSCQIVTCSCRNMALLCKNYCVLFCTYSIAHPTTYENSSSSFFARVAFLFN